MEQITSQIFIYLAGNFKNIFGDEIKERCECYVR